MKILAKQNTFFYRGKYYLLKNSDTAMRITHISYIL